MVLEVFPNSFMQIALFSKWVIGFRWEATALLLSSQPRLGKLAAETLPGAVDVQTSLVPRVKGRVRHGQLSFQLPGKCLRSASSRMGLWYLSVLSYVFWGPAITWRNRPVWSFLARYHKQWLLFIEMISLPHLPWHGKASCLFGFYICGVDDGNRSLLPRKTLLYESKLPWSFILHICFCRRSNTVCRASISAVRDGSEMIFPL